MMNNASVTWPDSPGWYWAYGRIAGMREAALMSARALLEGDQLIVYVGEAMTHRLSFPDPELPLQFKHAALPDFDREKQVRRIKLMVEQHPNTALSLWIEDEMNGPTGRYRGGYSLAENLDHAAFYRAVAHHIAQLAAAGDQVTYVDRKN